MRETDPFADAPAVVLSTREHSPYVNRMRLMWQAMREPVLAAFPRRRAAGRSQTAYLKAVEDIYVNDAYHSLSIEGYRVSPELIERVRSGTWNPDGNPRIARIAMRSRHAATTTPSPAVKDERRQGASGANAGRSLSDDHRDWYRQLFGPSVTAGIIACVISPATGPAPVYIRRSMHVPAAARSRARLHAGAVRAARGRNEPAARVVLGHFVFVYIHPVHGRQRPHGPLPDERDARVGRVSMDGHPGRATQRLHGRARSSERGAGHRPFAEFLGGLVGSTLRGAAAPPVPGAPR